MLRKAGRRIRKTIEASQTPAPTQKKGDRAEVSVLLGAVGIIACVNPVFGLPAAIGGLVLGGKSLDSKSRRTAIAGLVLSIVGLLLNVAVWLGQALTP